MTPTGNGPQDAATTGTTGTTAPVSVDTRSAEAPTASTSTPALLRTAAELDALPRPAGAERVVVMTMGALHEGHATLVRAAREAAGPDGQVVVTVFVNPLQFGEAADLDRYPRTLDADLATAADAGADAVFAPGVDEVYPGGEPQVRITAGPMGERLEGASRPGHFDGMLTVVAKLLHLTRPDEALYGQKDAQQLALIRRMVRDLNFPVRITGVPTVRDADGLALSSRNRFLSPQERHTALALSHALFAARTGSPPSRPCTNAPWPPPPAPAPTGPPGSTGSVRRGPQPTPRPSPWPGPTGRPPPSGPPPARSWTRRRPATGTRSSWTTWRWWTRRTSPRSPTTARAGRRSSP